MKADRAFLTESNNQPYPFHLFRFYPNLTPYIQPLQQFFSEYPYYPDVR